VGIGTASPSYLLNVSKNGSGGDSAQLARFTDTNTSNSLGPFHLTIGVANHYAFSPSPVLCGTNGIALGVGDGSNLDTQRRLTIDVSGNVGIGTSSPASYGSPLTVYLAANPTLTIASGNANAYLRLYSTSDASMYLANTGGSMTMITANTERMRIDSSGTLILNQGQIKFPSTQVASANANTLDDYEEGTWTPNVNGASVGSFSQKIGYYVKIGRQVTCWFRCDNGNTGAGGATQYVTGLPFNITTTINNSIMGQIGTNGPATRTLDLMALNANFAVAYVFTGGTQEPTAISFASGCFTYGID
jgi:hypothetical protein